MEVQVEALEDALLDAGGEVQDLGAGGVAVVDEDEGVVGGDAGVAVAVAFPAAGVDEPAGGEFVVGACAGGCAGHCSGCG